jgi:hypothetical protein
MAAAGYRLREAAIDLLRPKFSTTSPTQKAPFERNVIPYRLRGNRPWTLFTQKNKAMLDLLIALFVALDSTGGDTGNTPPPPPPSPGS